MTPQRVFFDVRAHHLYVHVPFCARRCVYCDFAIAVRSRVPVNDYLEALTTELAVRHRASTFDLETLYFGGGTPSKLGGEGVARLMDLVRSRAPLRPDAEVTLEVNPEDVSPQSARMWAATGVNRVSLGVQSFHDATLVWMHRTHDSNSARSAVQVLRDVGLANISVDLIFAVPSNLRRSWEKDLDTALELELSHLSVYGLTIEPHSPLGRWVARQTAHEAPEEDFEAQYLAAHDRLTTAGFEHYEVSNYGRPGFHSRHNWAYWQRRPYAGVGPSAHEFDGIRRRWNVGGFVEWMNQSRRSSDPECGAEELTPEQIQAEEVYLNLRTSKGHPISVRQLAQVEPIIGAGWARLGPESRLRLTGTGWLRLDSIARDLTALPSR